MKEEQEQPQPERTLSSDDDMFFDVSEEMIDTATAEASKIGKETSI